MTLISEEYRAMNAEMHQDPHYGAGHATDRWTPDIAELAVNMKAKSMLDYGCGKGMLAVHLRNHPQAHLLPPMRLYDPARPDFAKPPEGKFDLVTCTDVLEHIEPAHLKSVLKHLKSCVGRCGFFTIATRAAKRNLPDGRNAHLIQWTGRQWLVEMMKHFDISQFIDMGGECVMIVKSKT